MGCNASAPRLIARSNDDWSVTNNRYSEAAASKKMRSSSSLQFLEIPFSQRDDDDDDEQDENANSWRNNEGESANDKYAVPSSADDKSGIVRTLLRKMSSVNNTSGFFNSNASETLFNRRDSRLLFLDIPLQDSKPSDSQQQYFAPGTPTIISTETTSGRTPLNASTSDLIGAKMVSIPRAPPHLTSPSSQYGGSVYSTHASVFDSTAADELLQYTPGTPDGKPKKSILDRLKNPQSASKSTHRKGSQSSSASSSGGGGEGGLVRTNSRMKFLDVPFAPESEAAASRSRAGSFSVSISAESGASQRGSNLKPRTTSPKYIHQPPPNPTWAHPYHQIHCVEAHSLAVCSVALTPNGTLALTGSRDKTATLFKTKKGEVVYVLKFHTSYVLGVAMNDEGTRAMLASDDKLCSYWTLETGELLYTLRGHNASANCCALTKDGKYGVSGAGDFTARVWDLENDGLLLRTFSAAEESCIFNLCLFKDDRTVITCGTERVLEIWDILDGSKPTRRLIGHGDTVRGIAISRDQETILTVGGGVVAKDHSMKMWSAASGTLIANYVHPCIVYCVAITPDGNRAFTGGYDGIVRCWELNDESILYKIEAHSSNIWSLATTQDGEYLFTGGSDKTIRYFDVVYYQRMRVLILAEWLKAEEKRTKLLRGTENVPLDHQRILSLVKDMLC